MVKHFIAAALLAGIGMPFASHGETFNTCMTFIDSVPANISTQGVYCLRKDLLTGQKTGEAINVSTNNVTIDCNGYKIGGLSAGNDTMAYGIRAVGKQNVVVRGCNIRGFKYGVALSGAGLLVEDNSINQNTETGIYVVGDGSVIRNNRVFDTGAGTVDGFNARGIYASLTTDVRGNTVDGVVGPSDRNVDAWGIYVFNGEGVTVAENIIRNVAPTGTGSAVGIYLANGVMNFIDNNRVISTDSASLAFRCVPSAIGSMRGNSSWGFQAPSYGCIDDGQNVAH